MNAILKEIFGAGHKYCTLAGSAKRVTINATIHILN